LLGRRRFQRRQRTAQAKSAVTRLASRRKAAFLPRLFVYHCVAEKGSVQSTTSTSSPIAASAVPRLIAVSFVEIEIGVNVRMLTLIFQPTKYPQLCASQVVSVLVFATAGGVTAPKTPVSIARYSCPQIVRVKIEAMPSVFSNVHGSAVALVREEVQDAIAVAGEVAGQKSPVSIVRHGRPFREARDISRTPTLKSNLKGQTALHPSQL
jgi:hypothetical protein